MNKGAEFSPCKKYRYKLWRIWDDTLPLVMFIGLNPSTADEINDFNYDKMNLDVYDESDFEPLKTDNCNINIFSNKYDNSFKINPFYVVNTINQLLYNHYNYFLNHHTKLNNIVINNLTPITTNTKINSKKNL